MRSISSWQIKKIQTLISVLNLREEKESIVQAYSADGSTSTRGLSYQEATSLIDHLTSIQASMPGTRDKTETKKDVKRKKMMYLAYNLDWHLHPVADPALRTKSQRCMYHLDAWCRSTRSSVAKPIMEMTDAELDTAITQLRLIAKKSNSKQDKA